MYPLAFAAAFSLRGRAFAASSGNPTAEARAWSAPFSIRDQAGRRRGADPPTVRLAAVLHADVHEFSRLMALDEAHTHARLVEHLQTIGALAAAHEGRVAGGAGDSLLVEFPSMVQAVRAAATIQDRLWRRNRLVPPARRLEFRIGVHAGDVIADGAGIFGHSVNVAARLQALGAPGGVVVSRTVHEQVQGKVPVAFRDGGRRRVKNLPRPVRVYHLVDPTRPDLARAPASWARRVVGMALVAAATATAFALLI